MVDAKQMLNALVGAAASRMTGGAGAAGSAGASAGTSPPRGGASPVIGVLDGLLGVLGPRTGPADPYVQKVREFIGRNPAMAEAALATVAGTLIKGRRLGGIAIGAARLGGIALIATLAYKAYQSYHASKSTGAAGGEGAAALPVAAFDPASTTEDDALLMVRAMVAAATADGRVDNDERARIVKALADAGIDAQATRWLEDELASPANVDDLADPVQTPEKAAQVYAAARLAIDPDTIQEREFLRQLAESLDLDPEIVRSIDDSAAAVRA
jgi:uncharacterized membrane protein YebE (DUF533 family)